jgi:hypothetical protein
MCGLNSEAPGSVTVWHMVILQHEYNQYCLSGDGKMYRYILPRSMKLVSPKHRYIWTPLKVFTSQKTVLYILKLVCPKRRHICTKLKVVAFEKTVLYINTKESCVSNRLQREESENGNSSMVKEFSALCEKESFTALSQEFAIWARYIQCTPCNPVLFLYSEQNF